MYSDYVYASFIATMWLFILFTNLISHLSDIVVGIVVFLFCRVVVQLKYPATTLLPFYKDLAFMVGAIVFRLVVLGGVCICWIGSKFIPLSKCYGYIVAICYPLIPFLKFLRFIAGTIVCHLVALVCVGVCWVTWNVIQCGFMVIRYVVHAGYALLCWMMDLGYANAVVFLVSQCSCLTNKWLDKKQNDTSDIISPNDKFRSTRNLRNLAVPFLDPILENTIFSVGTSGNSSQWQPTTSITFGNILQNRVYEIPDRHNVEKYLMSKDLPLGPSCPCSFPVSILKSCSKYSS